MVSLVQTPRPAIQICKCTHIEILGVDLSVLGLVVVLLGDEHSLAEEVLVDLLAISLGDQPNRQEIVSFQCYICQ